jgi:ketosteroid isomerase-like protein
MASSERTPEQESNLKLANGGLEDWIAGDQEAAIATFADDVEVFVPPELGNAGSYTGIEQFRAWFANWDEAWSEFEMSIQDIEPVGERHVVAMIGSRGVGAGSGIEVANELAWVLGIREGKMEYLSLQPDRDAAHALVREREAA